MEHTFYPLSLTNITLKHLTQYTSIPNIIKPNLGKSVCLKNHIQLTYKLFPQVRDQQFLKLTLTAKVTQLGLYKK